MTPMEYLRWLRSLRRRLHEDFVNERIRRQWWARGVAMSPEAIIRTDAHSELEIGQGTLIGSHTVLDLLGDPLAETPARSIIRIGRRTAINEFNSIRASGSEIRIGDNCLLSQYVAIIGSNHGTQIGIPMRDQPWDATKRGVTIGDDVWIGTHVVILPGTNIGAGSVIAAGAVVNSDIPRNVIVAGIPATVKRFR